MAASSSKILPYPDTKDLGAADFYFGINATFRFIREKFGLERLRSYWQEMGRDYFRPVTDRWATGGLDTVAEYWQAFFAAEPGADVEVTRVEEKVVLHVRRCPAVAHLREHQRTIMPEFCQQCYFVSEALGRSAGISVRVCGGNGQCVQEFGAASQIPAQDLATITLCS